MGEYIGIVEETRGVAFNGIVADKSRKKPRLLLAAVAGEVALQTAHTEKGRIGGNKLKLGIQKNVKIIVRKQIAVFPAGLGKKQERQHPFRGRARMHQLERLPARHLPTGTELGQ